MDPLIVNAALTGMVPSKDDNPSVPVAPDEIAEDAACCVEAGATVVHLHARDADGNATYRADVYAEIVAKVRERCPDVIVCVSTSGRVFKTFEERSAVLDLDGDLKPDMASLTLGSLNFPAQASVNDPDMIRGLAERMAERAIVPELEVFDLGMVDYAHFLLARGVLRTAALRQRPPRIARHTLRDTGHLAAVVDALPAGSTWAGAGIGRFQFFVNGLAVAMGGHVRVGLEDNLWLDREKTRQATNLALVERLVRLAEAHGRPVATAAEARRAIGLPASVPSASTPSRA